jgi:hypothetical protein
LQDLIEAEYMIDGDVDEGEEEVGSEDEAGQKMLQDRKQQAQRRALVKSRAASEHQLALLEGGEKHGKSIGGGIC